MANKFHFEGELQAVEGCYLERHKRVLMPSLSSGETASQLITDMGIEGAGSWQGIL